MDSAGKRYSDKEIKEIIKRAAAIQAGKGAREEEGVSLEELVSIGEELGISAEAIRSATYAVAFAPADRRNPVLGESISISAHCAIDTAISKEQLVDLSEALSAITGESGTSTIAAGGIVAWKTDPFTALRRGIDMQVEVRRFSGGAHVTVRENLSAMAGGLFGGLVGGFGLGVGIGVGVGVGVGAMGSALFASLFPVGILALSYLGARFIYKGIVRNQRAKLAALARKICSFLGADDSPGASFQNCAPKGY